MRKRLVIVQPYVPTYRVAFFEGLIATLLEHNIECRIAASAPDATQGRRGDSAAPQWVVPVSQRKLSVLGRSLVIGGARSAWRDADAVIVGLAGSALDTYRALLDGMTSPLKVGVWGHIKSYVNAGHPLDLALEKWQLRTADHVFAYTPGGAEYALTRGVRPDQLTTVMNAVDTTTLAEAAAAVTDARAAEFASKHGIDPSRTLAFIGGLDASKRIDFLADSLDLLWDQDPTVKILVGGLGSQAHLLEKASHRGQAVLLGYVNSQDQALIARTSMAMVMPGRIGLVAVDSMVLGLPIITTDWAYHAPESEYLVEGVDRITSEDSIPAFVQTIRGFLSNPTEPSRSKGYPTLEQMVKNYAAGVVKMLEPKDD